MYASPVLPMITNHPSLMFMRSLTRPACLALVQCGPGAPSLISCLDSPRPADHSFHNIGVAWAVKCRGNFRVHGGG